MIGTSNSNAGANAGSTSNNGGGSSGGGSGGGRAGVPQLMHGDGICHYLILAMGESGNTLTFGPRGPLGLFDVLVWSGSDLVGSYRAAKVTWTRQVNGSVISAHYGHDDYDHYFR